jgi:hypothetical protein
MVYKNKTSERKKSPPSKTNLRDRGLTSDSTPNKIFFAYIRQHTRRKLEKQHPDSKFVEAPQASEVLEELEKLSTSDLKREERMKIAHDNAQNRAIDRTSIEISKDVLLKALCDLDTSDSELKLALRMLSIEDDSQEVREAAKRVLATINQ